MLLTNTLQIYLGIPTNTPPCGKSNNYQSDFSIFPPQLLMDQINQKNKLEKRAEPGIIRLCFSYFHSLMSRPTKRLRSSHNEEANPPLKKNATSNVNPRHLIDYTRLMHASSDGKTADVTELLAAKADVNYRHPRNQWTALMFAAAKNQTTVMKILLQAKAAVDIRGSDGNTALTLAAKRGHNAATERLLAARATVDKKDNTQRDALSWAASEGHLTVVKTLLKAKAPLGSEDGTALMLAAYNGHWDCTKALLRAEKKLNSVTYGLSATVAAAKNGFADMMSVLLEANASLDLSPDYYNSLVQLAVTERHADVLSVLLSQRTSDRYVDLLNAHVAAVENRDVAVAKVLSVHPLSYKDGVELQEKLLEMAEEGQWEYVRELIKAGVKVNIIDGDGNTVLMIAAIAEHEETVEFLIQRKASVDARNGAADTALIIAARGGHTNITKTLLNGGASCHRRNSAGENAWEIAMKASNAELMRGMQECAQIKPDLDMALVDMASDGNISSAKILVEMKANVSSQGQRGNKTALMVAASKNNIEMLSFLIAEKAPLNDADVHGLTALHHAARGCCAEAINVLRGAGAVMDVCDGRGRTPLMYLAQADKHGAVKCLLECTGREGFVAGGTATAPDTNRNY